MNKSELIEKQIKEIQKEKELLFFEDVATFDNVELENISFKDLVPYFQKLDNIESISTTGCELEGDIYTDLAKLKNLKNLDLRDLSKTERFIDNLKKIKKLETLDLTGSNLSKFPKSIFKISTLKKLSIIWNDFYISNFNFSLKKKCENIYTQIAELDKTLIQYKWGLTNSKGTVLILKDNAIDIDKNSNPDFIFESKKHSISIFALKGENPYNVFKTYVELFTKLEVKNNCFVKKTIQEKETLDIFHYFIEKNLTISFEELKKIQKSGKKQYTVNFSEYFVADILQNIGGEELIEEIEKERKKEQKLKIEAFDKIENKRITSVVIKNFKLFSSLEIEELSKINIIIGKNGMGKTSLLQALAIGLVSGNSTEITKSGSRRYENFINKELKDKSEYLQYAEIVLKWSQKYERKQHIYVNELLIDRELPNTYLSLAYGENLFTNEQYTIYNYLKYLEEGSAENVSVQTLFNNYNVELPNPLEILDNLQSGQLRQSISKEKTKELLVISKLLLSTLNDFLKIEPNNIFKIQYVDYNYKFINQKGLSFNLYQISEGYRTNIVLITDILIKILSARNTLFLKPFEVENYNQIFKEVKGTIIIDEFDKHLHPVWQKTFIGTLRNKLPNIQFILTTHNPVALQSAEGEKAFILDENGITEKEIKKGWSIETLFNEFFNWNNEFFGKQTEILFEIFYNLLKKLKKKTITKGELIKLKETTNELLLSSEEVSTIIKRELLQLERQTGKTFEL